MYTNSIVRLSSIETEKDIHPMSAAVRFGAYCPFPGAALLLDGIEDAWVVMIGDKECASYVKELLQKEVRCFSFVMNHHDQNAGSAERLKKTLLGMIAEKNPPAIFLLSAGLVEITSDDMESFAHAVHEETGVPVTTVQAEHFGRKSHQIDMERALCACIELMQPARALSPKSVNILGNRFGSLESLELYNVLKACGLGVNLCLPNAHCTVESIRWAAMARVNIVVDPIALPLAKQMQAEFGNPYVLFYKECSPERIYAAYTQLFAELGIEGFPLVRAVYERCWGKAEHNSNALRGKRFICGNTSIPPFALAAFLSTLGMVPLIIQACEVTAADAPYIQEILAMGHDPYVVATANLAPMRAYYGHLRPDYFIGQESSDLLAQYGIAYVDTDAYGKMLGFALAEALLDCLANPAHCPKANRWAERRSLAFATNVIGA